LHHQIQFLDAEMFRIKIYFNDKMFISNAILTFTNAKKDVKITKCINQMQKKVFQKFVG